MATGALHLNFTILTVGMFLYNLEALGLEKTHSSSIIFPSVLGICGLPGIITSKAFEVQILLY